MTAENMPLVTYDSPYSVKETIDRIVQVLESKGITIFARIDHGVAAKKVGLMMQDEEVLVFGDPRVGTVLMLENPAIGIELPLKIIAWHNNGATKVGYQKLNMLVQNYRITQNLETVTKMQMLLDNLVKHSIAR